MDQFISANGQENHALLLDCRDLSFRLAPIPAHIALVDCQHHGETFRCWRRLHHSPRRVEAACATIARHRPEVRFLRDATVEDLEKWGHEMTPNSLKRARHVVTENLRTQAAAEALAANDLAELGRLMAEAHRSYSQDFEGSCAEADAMVELARQLPGLIGARLTGGGFGGCTINLVEQSQAAAFAKALAGRYADRIGIEPQDSHLPCLGRRSPVL